MVYSIDPIDPTTTIQPIIPIEDTTENPEAIAVPEEEQPVETDSFQSSQIAFEDYQIRDYVTNYVNNLVTKFEGYDDIVGRLLSYLGTFDVNHFKQNYPTLETSADLSTALYNETQRFL